MSEERTRGEVVSEALRLRAALTLPPEKKGTTHSKWRKEESRWFALWRGSANGGKRAKANRLDAKSGHFGEVGDVVRLVQKVANANSGGKVIAAFCKGKDGMVAVAAALHFLSRSIGEGKESQVKDVPMDLMFDGEGEGVNLEEEFERLLVFTALLLRKAKKDSLHAVVFASSLLSALAQAVARLSAKRTIPENGKVPQISKSALSSAADIIGTLAAVEDKFAAHVMSSAAPQAVIYAFQQAKLPRNKALSVSRFYPSQSPQLSEEERKHRKSYLRMKAALGINAPRSLQSRFLSRSGVRILAIDGGGTRALMAIEILKRLEELTGKRIAEMFDLIAGTSTGGVLAIGIGLAGRSLDDCEHLYRQFGKKIFTARKQGAAAAVVSAGKLLFLNRGQYDTVELEQRFKEHAGFTTMIDTRHEDLNVDPPRVFVVSTLIRSSTSPVSSPRPYLHCNYRPPPGQQLNQHRYTHGCHHPLWEALRATTAAPTYFDPLNLGGDVFVDGAMLVNNPAAIAVHEARLLWPGSPLDLVVSVGTGRFSDAGPGAELKGAGTRGSASSIGTDTNSMLLGVARAVIDSATDTEAVHHALEDLAPAGVYYRFNARMQGPPIPLDEARVEYLDAMQNAARQYASSGGEADKPLRKLAKTLTGSSSPLKWWMPWNSRL